MRTRAAVITLLVAVITSARGAELALDARAIEDAIAIGRSPIERDRARFHAGYRFTSARSPVDFVDIVTPFRRVVLASYQRARIGGGSIGQRQAMEVLAAAPGWIDTVVELTFHPLNAFVNVPPYDVTLRGVDGATIRPRGIDRLPRFGPRVEGTPLPIPGTLIRRQGEPLLGGTVVASFDGSRLNPAATYDVVVSENGKEVARVRVELGRLR